MPGPLQWNNVAAPNFGDAIQGYKTFADLMDRAASSGQDAMKGIVTAQDMNANRQLQLNLQKYVNPDGTPDVNGVNMAAANGSLYAGLNPNKLTPDQIAFATGQHVTDLLNNIGKDTSNRQAGENLTEQQYGFGRTQKQNTALDALAPTIAQIGAANGDQKTIDAIKSSPATQALMAALTPDNQSHVNGIIGDTITGRTGQNMGLEDLRDKKWTQDITERNDRWTQEANGLVMDWQKNANNGQSLQAYINNHPEFKDKYSPTVLLAAANGTLSQLQSFGAGANQGGPGSAASNADVPNSGYDATYGFGTYGLPPKAPSTMSMGEISDFGDNTLRPQTKAANIGIVNGKPVGTSAMGAYQIEGSTLKRIAPILFGANWRNMTFSPENQDKMGQYLFNEAKQNGTDLHKVWEGLPKGTSPNGKTWADVRSDILAAESRGGKTNPVASNIDLSNQVTAAITALQQNSGGDQDQRFFRNAAPTLQMDSKDAHTVADELIKSGAGAFANEDSGRIADKINEIAGQYKISPALAGQVLLAASSHERGALSRGWHSGFGTGWWGDNIRHVYDDKSIQHYASLAQNRTALQSAGTSANTNIQSITYLKSAQQRWAEAAQALRAAQIQNNTTGSTVDLRPLQANLDRATSFLRDALVNAKVGGISGGKDHNDQAPPSHVATNLGEAGTSVSLKVPAARGTVRTNPPTLMPSAQASDLIRQRLFGQPPVTGRPIFMK